MTELIYNSRGIAVSTAATGARGPQLSIIPYEISKSSDFGIDSKISRRFQRDSKISQRFPARFQPTMILRANCATRC